MTPDTESWKTGYIHVYTGDGKGKTTAALGLALRAAGAGIEVFIAQFMKGRPSSELRALARFDDLITVRRYGRETLICGEPDEEDRRLAREGLADVRAVLEAGTRRVVIMDEANTAAHFKLFTVEQLLEVMDARPAHVELILTGRHADRRIIERADLVTDMRPVKHYYHRGVQARRGIEE